MSSTRAAKGRWKNCNDGCIGDNDLQKMYLLEDISLLATCNFLALSIERRSCTIELLEGSYAIENQSGVGVLKSKL